MKKSLISIPAIAAPTVLATLHKNNIETVYMGLDQSGRLIMQITHSQDQTALILELEDFMKQCDSFIFELGQAVKNAIEERNKSIDNILSGIKTKRQERAKQEEAKKETEIIE